MHVARARERSEHLEIAARHPRQPKQRHSRGKVKQLRFLADPPARHRKPLGGARLGDPLPQPPPQLSLPRALRTPAALAARPAPKHLGAVHGVAVKQVGDPAHRAETPSRIPGLATRSVQVGCERRKPRLLETLVDNLKQRPHRSFNQPPIVVRIDPSRSRQRTDHQPAGERELNVRAHPVEATLAAPEPRRQPLAQATARSPASGRRPPPPRTDPPAARAASSPDRRPNDPRAPLYGRGAPINRLILAIIPSRPLASTPSTITLPRRDKRS